MTTFPQNLERRPRTRQGLRRGFTLIELMVVMTIIGIIVTFVLIASLDGIRQAEIRATEALILKLEAGLNDRLDALLQTVPQPNYTQGYLAGVYPAGMGNDADGRPRMVPAAILPTGAPNPAVRNTARARAIALADYMKAEMPDVFSVRPDFLRSPNNNNYPLNFAARSMAGGQMIGNALAGLVTPVGHAMSGPRHGFANSGLGDSRFSVQYPSSNPDLGMLGRGIFGASYFVAAGIYKNLGYLPEGYDGIDNNGNNLIDEWGEGIDNSNRELVLGRLRAHRHETTRSEMLYALLVEGQGPFGAVFSPDDFSDREVKDTDGDGLPEFVDAWGKPLQFYRWPLFYHSESQRGVNIGLDMASSGTPLRFLDPYASIFEAREQNPLDPNQSLMAPAWWDAGHNSEFPMDRFFAGTAPSIPGESLGAVTFERLFHRLSEPLEYVPPSDPMYFPYWDRAGNSRRAFYTKPLILSGGPDQTPGVFVAPSLPTNEFVAGQMFVMWENNAIPFVPSEVMGVLGASGPAGLVIPASRFDMTTNPQTFNLLDAGRDDITNHAVNSTAGSGG